jgi:uncharacterized protein (TIGR02646 family)
VCAYCGQGLKGDRSDSHIDHFWPQQYFNPQSMPDRPDRTLDYENFFASCGPPGLPTAVGRIPSTCGDHKGNWFDPTNYIMPSHVGCEQRFSYGANGQIMPASPTDAAAANMISVLNLNEPALQYQRQQIIIGIEQAIAAGDFTLATRDDEIAAWRRPNDGKLKSFGHVAARYLESEPL